MSDIAEGVVQPTETLEPNDRVISSPSGVLTVTIPARSGGGWGITYCGKDYDDSCIYGQFPELEFRFPRKNGGFDVFPFNAPKRQFGEPYSIEPGFGRKLQNIVTDRRLHLAALLATLIASVSGIFCNTGDDDNDVNDTEPPVTDKVEPDEIG